MQFCKSSEAVKNKNGFIAYSRRLVLSHTDTLYQPAKTGKKAGEMTQQNRTFFHTHSGIFMWNETGRGVHDHHSLFKHCQT
jgi:hypothetical protein